MWRVAGRKEIDEATAPLPAELQAVFQVLPPTAETVESVQKLAEAVAWQGPPAGEQDSPPALAELSAPAPAKPEVEADAPAPMCRLSFRGHRSDTGASGPAA